MAEWTPAQVVAYNVKRLREENGWSQADAARNCGPYLPGGESWSPQVWSMMERSVGGQRVRAFAADELVGLALGLKAPLVALFLPPHPEAKRLSRICADDGKKGTSTLGLLKLVTEIDEATRSRIRKLAGPITDQVGGPDWRELEITFVEQEREAQIYQEMKGLVSRLTELLRTPAWFDD